MARNVSVTLETVHLEDLRVPNNLHAPAQVVVSPSTAQSSYLQHEQQNIHQSLCFSTQIDLVCVLACRISTQKSDRLKSGCSCRHGCPVHKLDFGSTRHSN